MTNQNSGADKRVVPPKKKAPTGVEKLALLERLLALLWGDEWRATLAQFDDFVDSWLTVSRIRELATANLEMREKLVEKWAKLVSLLKIPSKRITVSEETELRDLLLELDVSVTITPHRATEDYNKFNAALEEVKKHQPAAIAIAATEAFQVAEEADFKGVLVAKVVSMTANVIRASLGREVERSKSIKPVDWSKCTTEALITEIRRLVKEQKDGNSRLEVPIFDLTTYVARRVDEERPRGSWSSKEIWSDAAIDFAITWLEEFVFPILKRTHLEGVLAGLKAERANRANGPVPNPTTHTPSHNSRTRGREDWGEWKLEGVLDEHARIENEIEELTARLSGFESNDEVKERIARLQRVQHALRLHLKNRRPEERFGDMGSDELKLEMERLETILPVADVSKILDAAKRELARRLDYGGNDEDYAGARRAKVGKTGKIRTHGVDPKLEEQRAAAILRGGAVPQLGFESMKGTKKGKK